MSVEDLGETGEAVSRAEAVYGWIRERIIDGTLQPGARIREREIAEQLGVSRIPIREALPHLESEGFIRTLPRRGAVVTEMTRQDVAELFDVRSSLEVLGARLAARECASGASPDRLLAALADAAGAVAAGGQPRIAEANARLHVEILDLSGNALLQHLMAPISARVRRLFHIVTERNQPRLHTEHEALCAAIVAGNAELAGALALAHVEQSRQESMPIVDELLP